MDFYKSMVKWELSVGMTSNFKKSSGNFPNVMTESRYNDI